MSLLSAFTNQLMNLMNELHELYPEDRDIETKKTGQGHRGGLTLLLKLKMKLVTQCTNG